LTLMASSLYRLLACRIGNGYDHAKSRHLFRDFVRLRRGSRSPGMRSWCGIRSGPIIRCWLPRDSMIRSVWSLGWGTSVCGWSLGSLMPPPRSKEGP
jgi:hypothetical protein